MNKKFFYILAISFIISFIFITFTKEPMQPDSYGYDSIGWNLAQGHGYTNAENKITMEREPMYPFFLAFIYFIFGHTYLPVQIIQIVLFLLTVILVYKIAEAVFNKEIAWYAMAMTAFFPTLVNFPSYILSETLFTFLTSLLVFGCIKIYFTNKWGYYFLTGLALGAAALCKSIMLPFIFIVIIWLLLLRDKAGWGIKERIMKISVIILIFCGTVTPWMHRNYADFGSFSLREGSEVPLCVKVEKLDYNLQDFKEALIFTISENLGGKMFPDITEDPRYFLFKEDVLARGKILPELREKGYSSKEIKNMMISAMIKRPVKFLAVSSLDLLKMTQFTYLPILIDQQYLIKKMTNARHGVLLLSLSRGIFRFLAYLLILFSMMAMWVGRAEWRKWIFLVILICYTNLIYSLIYGHGRYGVPLIPYYVMLSVSIIAGIKNKQSC
jgi:4-amino-4-deoxy-L-arabinose transferase-like glycosyltransferase